MLLLCCVPARAQLTLADQAQAWVNHGLQRAAAGDHASAIYAYKRAIELSPRMVQAHAQLGISYYASLQYAAAEQALETAARLAPEDSSLQRALATVYVARRRVDDAIVLLQRLVRAHPRDLAAQTLLGRTLLTANRGADAIGPLTAAVALAPADADLRLDLARAYHAGGDPLKAEVQLRTALRLRTDFEAAQRLLAAIYIESGRYLSAHPLLKSLLGRYPADPELLKAYADASAQVGLTAEARGARETLVWTLPPDAAVRERVRIADAAMAGRDLATALTHLSAAYALAPRDDAVRLRLAQCYEALGRVEDAARLWESLGEASGRRVASLIALGDLWLAHGRPAEALGAYERALELDPGRLQALAGAVDAAVALGLSDRALERMSVLVAIRPADSEQRTRLVSLLAGAGELGQALGQAEELSARRGGLSPLHAADIARRAGQPALEARYLATLADSAAQLRRAQVLAQMGRENEADAVLARLTAEPIDRRPATVARYRLRVLSGRYDEAAVGLAALLSADSDDAEAQRLLARCASARGNDVAAFALLESTLRRGPGSAAVAEDLVTVAERTGRLPQAARLLTGALHDLRARDASIQEQLGIVRELCRAIAGLRGQGAAAAEVAGIARLYAEQPEFAQEAALAWRRAGAHAAAGAQFAALAAIPRLALSASREAAVSYLAAEHYNAAWEMAGRWVSLQPDQAEFVATIARLGAATGSSPPARDALGRLLAARPGTAAFEVARVEIHALVGQLAEVAERETLRLSMAPDDPALAAGVMSARVRLREDHLALAVWDRLGAGVRADPEVATIAAEALARAGRLPEAIAALENLPGVLTPEGLVRLGGLYEAASRFGDALIAYSTALLPPDPPQSAAEAIVRLGAEHRVPVGQILDALTWAYMDADQPDLLRRLALSVANATGSVEPLEWLSARPSPRR